MSTEIINFNFQLRFSISISVFFLNFLSFVRGFELALERAKAHNILLNILFSPCGICKYFLILKYQRRRNLNTLRVRFFKHEWLKFVLRHAHKFVKFYYILNLSSFQVIKKKIFFSRNYLTNFEIFNKYFLHSMADILISWKICKCTVQSILISI